MKGKNTYPAITILLIGFLMLFLWACDELPNAPGTDVGNLSALTVSSGELSPAFESATTEYTVVLPTGTSSIAIIATVSDSSNTVKVDGTVVVSGSVSGAVSLAEGLNTVAIEVFSSDGTLLKTYSLKIIVGGFKVSGTLTLTNGEDGSGKKYKVAVTGDFDSGDIVSAEGTWSSGSIQGFVLNNVPPGVYYLYALIDWDADDSFDGLYPDYGGMYGWAFESLDTFLQTGTPPGDPNFTVADKDLSANISDIQQIPDSVTDGTITVNLTDAAAYAGYNFGFAVFNNGEMQTNPRVADGNALIAGDGTAGSVAYEDVTAVPLVEFTGTGGSYYDIFVMVDLDGNGVTSDGDYIGTIEDVYVNGNVSASASFNDMTVYSAPVN